MFMSVLGALGGLGIGVFFAMSQAALAFTAAIPAVGPAMALFQEGEAKKYMKKALVYGAVGAASGFAAGSIAGAGLSALMGTQSGDTAAAETVPRFKSGGTVTTPQAVVHPGEMVITGGQGSEVISQKDFKELLDGIKTLAAGNGGTNQVAVYIGQEKIDEIVVKALDSEAGRTVLSPYSMV